MLSCYGKRGPSITLRTSLSALRSASPCADASPRGREHDTTRGMRALPFPSFACSLPAPGTLARNRQARRAPRHGWCSPLRPRALERQPKRLQRAHPLVSPLPAGHGWIGYTIIGHRGSLQKACGSWLFAAPLIILPFAKCVASDSATFVGDIQILILLARVALIQNRTNELLVSLGFAYHDAAQPARCKMRRT